MQLLLIYLNVRVMPKIVNAALKAKVDAKAWTFEAKAKTIKFGLKAPRGQGQASRTTSLYFTLVVFWIFTRKV